MKKYISLIIITCLAAIYASAADFTGVKIYINPGHGGYNGANDRNLPTINFALEDTLGFWESYSNLRKGLALRDMLQAANATVYMSRTLNREEDDRPLSEIAEEANANNVDAFLSIHSNALGTNTGTNYLLLLFHGYDNAPTVEQSLPMATAAWPRLITNQLTVWTHYTTSTNIRGDFTFYGNTTGLGVLRPLTVPGFLSEGSFHDYQPETHRLLNDDYRKLEAISFYRYFCDYFSAQHSSKGVIAGFVKGQNETINHPKFTYKAGTHDRWMPLNGAGVKLMNAAGDSLDFYQVDTLYNGIFAFHNLAPGTYKLRLTCIDHTPKDTTVTVVAAVTTYAKMYLVNENIVIPKDTTPDYPHPVQEAGIAPLKNYRFADAATSTPEWLSEAQIRKAVFRNEKLYVLTETPKIIIANAVTFQKIREMDLTGISGGMLTLSDIAFTSDGYLLACNKDTVGLPETKGRIFKVYTWDNDSVAPKLLFQTLSQGNWSNGIIGETFAVSGPRWKCKIHTTSVTAGSSKQIRIVGLQYEEEISAVGYKYMLNTAEYTEALWGTKPKFMVSPTGGDHLIIDSDKILPREYQFDWSKPDRDPLILKGEFAEKSGYNIENIASGSNFFRHAKRVFMASPVCNADSSQVGVMMFDVTDGLQNAVKISAKIKETGLGEPKASYMMAGAKVSGYDIDLLVLAQNQGVARYKSTVPETRANIYASELKAVSSNGGYKLKFTLNENADAVTVDIFRAGEKVHTIDAGALEKGQHEVNFQTEGMNGGSYTWSVTASTSNIDRPLKFSDNNQPQLQFYSPRGVAVDNHFDSPFFGRVYASETVPGPVTNRTTKDGVYVLNAALEDVTGQGANSYAGGVAWGGSSSPMRLAVAEDGRVFITDWSDAHPGVWIMDPANPAAPFKAVFESLSNPTSGLSSFGGVNVHGSISHCRVLGTGENTQLFTFDEDYIDAVATSPGNLLRYDIGNLTTPWQSAPSAVVYNDAVNGNLQQNYNSCIAPDSRGGWWISQYRGSDAAAIPSLIHVNPAGTVDFNSGLTPALIENSYTGGMDVSFDGKRIAMGCNNEVKVFEVSFNGEGVPSLRRLHSIKPAMGTNTAGISFDRAGNLYVISNTSERLGVWALPMAVNSFTTPAPASQAFYINWTGMETVENALPAIKVYPNPATDFVTVAAEGAVLQSVLVYDLKGQMLINEMPAQTDVNISIGHLQPGVYILKAKTESGTESFRIIKK